MSYTARKAYMPPPSAAAPGARLGAPQAITATAHKLARSLYNLMRHGLAYVQKTETAYAEQVRERQERQLQRRAQELGYELKKIEPLDQVLAAAT